MNWHDFVLEQPPVRRIQRPCSAPNCPALVESGYCAAHAARAVLREKQYDSHRGSSAKRGYDSVWKRFRKWFLSQTEHAICEDCQREPSTEVHHVKKVADFPGLRLVESNCRGLCKTCHSARTARGE